MRPLYLRLTNYRGYASQELDLSGVRSLLLFGPTGAGKSAIPGAMLWALSGRNGSGDPRGHLKLGAELVRVEFSFEHAGNTYRVIRTQSFKTARGKHECQLAVSDGKGGWTVKSEKSVDETTEAIARLLGMGYEELIAGPIALQDQAGRFLEPGRIRLDGRELTGRSARLELTKKMLGLSQYEAWRVAATAEAKDLDGKATILEAQVVETEGALATREEKTSTLAGAEAIIRTNRGQQELLSAQIGAGSRELAGLEARIPAAEKELVALAEDRRILTSRGQVHGIKSAKASRFRDLLARRREIEAEAARATALDADLARQREALAGIVSEGKGIAEQIKTAERQVMERQQSLDGLLAKLKGARQKIAKRDQLGAEVVALTEAREARQVASLEISEIDGKIAEARLRRDAISTANAVAQQRRGEILADESRISAEKAGLEPQILGHEKRIAVMDAVPCTGIGDLPQRCPLLQDARDSVAPLAILRLRRNDLCAWVRPPLPEILPTDELDRMLRGLHSDRQAIEQRLKTIEATIQRLASSELELASLETIAAGIPGLESEAEAALESLSQVSKAFDALQGARESAKGRYTGLQAEIKSAESARALLQGSVDLLPELAHAQDELPGLEAEIQTLAGEMADLTAKVGRGAELESWISTSNGSVARLMGELAGWREDLSRAQEAEKATREALAILKVELSRLDDLAIEQAKARREAASLRERHSLVSALAEAYRQIPVMILENIAIPVLEEEANRFLARTSRNRMSVRLETQREIKSREALADGLEIYVRDWRGERSIDDFSGGQRFELFLAFRVAWTKLQERRSGIGVNLLVLDEGFGALSAGDLEGVMTALREVQQQMEFLMVISHVEAMKDIFPARLDVTGGEVDSRAQLSIA